MPRPTLPDLALFWLLSIAAAEPAVHPVEQAAAHLRAQRWEAAGAAFGTLVAANPHHALYRYRLGIALARLERWDEAITAFEQARNLGARAFDCDYRIARAQLGAGRREAALDWLERAAIDDAPANAGLLGFIRDDASLEPLRKERRFRALVGSADGQPVASALDAVGRRREDLDFLVDRLRRVHYDLHHRLEPEAFDRAVADLRERLATLDDDRFIAELARLVASIGDGHTSLWPSPARPTHYLPFHLDRFADGLFVRAAAPAYGDLVGSRVRSIGGRPVEDLFEAAARFLAHDNVWQLYGTAPKAFAEVALLRTFGADVAPQRVDLVLEKDGERLETTIAGIPETEAKRQLAPVLAANPRFDWRIEPPTWSSMQVDAASEPLWLRHPFRAYWLDVVEDRQLIYVQVNDAREEDDLPFTAFVDRLFKSVDELRPRAMVIDIRLNSGGRTHLSEPLVKRLAGHPDLDRRGALFVIIGRRTSSAGMRFAARLDVWTDAIFVGEPTGQPPNVHGGTNRFRLPHSGKTFTVSSRYWIGGRTTDDTRPWIAPDLAAELTSSDYAAGRDPAFEAILSYLDP